MDLFDTFFGELLMTFLIAMVPVLEPVSYTHLTLPTT